MTFLLDTHILIWAAAGTLPEEAVPLIAGPDNVLLFSPASIWEVVIKRGLGHEGFRVDPLALYRGLLDSGYNELDITGRHVLAVSELPPIHKDPFDRLLLAQARTEGAVLMTADAALARYQNGIRYIQR